MQAIRGRRMSMIFQEPQAALDPLATIGTQIAEALRRPLYRARPAVRKMLEDVGISDPDRRIDQRPFELSGGMCQRVLIASALISRPAILIADEPTTALDVTIQAQILDLLRHLAIERHTAVVLITHDMGVVADIADRLAVMYAGRIAEAGPTDGNLRRSPSPLYRAAARLHPAPVGYPEVPARHHRGPCAHAGRIRPGLPLRQSLPARRCTLHQRNPETAPDRPSPPHRLPPCRSNGVTDTLEITDLKVHFAGRGGAPIRAVDGVSLSIAPGETLGLVGESGCGKSTVSNASVGLIRPPAAACASSARNSRAPMPRPCAPFAPAPRWYSRIPSLRSIRA